MTPASDIDVNDPTRGIRSTKLLREDRARTIFPYYAGFSDEFVAGALKYIGYTPDMFVLDPWNGSGTTTTVAARLGLRSVGIDLNPVSKVVAQAKLAAQEDAQSLFLFLKTCSNIRSIKNETILANIKNIVSKFDELSYSPTLKISEAPYMRDLLLVCAFRYFRKQVKSFKSQNPTWYNSIDSDSLIERAGDTASGLAAFANEFIEKLNNREQNQIVKPKILTDNSLDYLRRIRRKFDIVITSPPYLTRIDYIKATLPEVLVLEHLNSSGLQHLRHKMIGSPITRSIELRDPLSRSASQVLDLIYSHASKASSTYYYKFYSAYFQDLFDNLTAIGSKLRPSARLCLVVQPSFYKEIFVDLPAICCEALTHLGAKKLEQFVFPGKASMISVNSRAASSKIRPSESLIIAHF